MKVLNKTIIVLSVLVMSGCALLSPPNSTNRKNEESIENLTRKNVTDEHIQILDFNINSSVKTQNVLNYTLELMSSSDFEKQELAYEMLIDFSVNEFDDIKRRFIILHDPITIEEQLQYMGFVHIGRLADLANAIAENNNSQLEGSLEQHLALIEEEFQYLVELYENLTGERHILAREFLDGDLPKPEFRRAEALFERTCPEGFESVEGMETCEEIIEEDNRYCGYNDFGIYLSDNCQEYYYSDERESDGQVVFAYTEEFLQERINSMIHELNEIIKWNELGTFIEDNYSSDISWLNSHLNDLLIKANRMLDVVEDEEVYQEYFNILDEYIEILVFLRDLEVEEDENESLGSVFSHYTEREEIDSVLADRIYNFVQNIQKSKYFEVTTNDFEEIEAHYYQYFPIVFNR